MKAQELFNALFALEVSPNTHRTNKQQHPRHDVYFLNKHTAQAFLLSITKCDVKIGDFLKQSNILKRLRLSN